MTNNEIPANGLKTLAGIRKNTSWTDERLHKNHCKISAGESQNLRLLEDSRILLSKTRTPRIFAPEVIREVTHRVFTNLIDELVLSNKMKQLLMDIGLSEQRIIRRCYRNCPSEIFNLILCSKLAMKFGALHSILGFIRTEYGAYRLNLRPQLQFSGLLAPERTRDGLIQHLRVFRSITDSRSFILRSTFGQEVGKWI